MENKTLSNTLEYDCAKYYGDLRVAVYQGNSFYGNLPPFNPHMTYPEYIFHRHTLTESNPGYDAVRNCFRLLELDNENFGTTKWNPLGDIIHPGEKVVVKPNFVLSSHSEGGNLFSIITHPSIIRAVVDYAYKALNGYGEIVIADAPQMDCDFEELLNKTSLASIQDLYWKEKKFELQIFDLREFWLDTKAQKNRVYLGERKKLQGDPLGSEVINLGKESEFYQEDKPELFYGADYNRDETFRHHSGEMQEYKVSKSILSADTIIFIPKLKVHKKVGVTLTAKGLVGINTDKNYLVHYKLGPAEAGGDQFPTGVFRDREKLILRTQRFLSDLLLARKNQKLESVYIGLVTAYRNILKPIIGEIGKDKLNIDGGNWFGNDSAWRMVADLIKIIMYADKNGSIQRTPQRKLISMIDGIIGGEMNGPLLPSEKRAGVVLMGFNPIATDIVGTRLMGFNWEKIHYIRNSVGHGNFSVYVDRVDEIPVISNIAAVQEMFHTSDRLLNFRAHPGWKGHIELD